MIIPRHIKIESSSLCQLRCPSCPTATGAVYPELGKGWLRASNLQKLLDENPWVSEVELSNYGEMFLNPQLLEIMKIARAKKTRLMANNGVNLNRASKQVLEGLVRYRFYSLKCSIDGSTKQTYMEYRVGGDFEKVLANVRTINRFKKKYRSKYPLLTWQFIAFRHNVHEIPSATRLAKELGMRFTLKLSWDASLSPYGDNVLLRKSVGASSREEYRRRFRADYGQGICRQLWGRPQINWDGKVLGCMRNFWGNFGGNAFTDGLLPSLNNERIAYARDMLQGLVPVRKDIPCAHCHVFKNMAAEGNWFKQAPLPLTLLRKYVLPQATSSWLKSLALRNPKLLRGLRNRV